MSVPVNAILEAAELLYLRFRVRAASVGALPSVIPSNEGKINSSKLDKNQDQRVHARYNTYSEATIDSGGSVAGLAGASRGGIRLLEVLDRIVKAEDDARLGPSNKKKQ